MNTSNKLKGVALEITNRLSDVTSINEITLSGSISRNLADEYSDIELDFWCESIPDNKEKNKILEAIGAVKIRNTGPNSDGSEESEFYINGALFEVTWQSYQNIEKLIESVFSLKNNNHESFVYLWTLKYLETLKNNGRIEKIKSKILNNYPTGLRKQLINKTLDEDLIIPLSRLADIKRNEFFSLNLKLIEQTKAILRMLYALNQEWEIYWKWIYNMAELELKLKPQNLVERINECFLNLNNPKKALKINYELYIDTLELVKVNLGSVEKERINSKIKLIKQVIEKL